MAKRKGKGGSVATTLIIIAAVISVILGRFNESFETVNKPVGDDGATYCVYFIDVGQGSATLLKSGNTGVLVDAGERESGAAVCDFITSCGVEKLAYVVATHPHTDHIGGLLKVLEEIPTDNVIMPKLTAENTPTTKTYETLLQTLYDKNIKVIKAKYGAEYMVDRISFTILGPVEQNTDLNNMSVICKATVNSTTFLLSGDAEKSEMSSVMEMLPNLSCDIMLMGHHGSKTSLEKSFLSAAAPNAAIISCGLDNSYGHPHKETLKYLASNGIDYYRTDKSGTIKVECHEGGYTIDTQK